MARDPATRRLRVDWALVLIVLLGASFRLQHVGLPMAEAHSWRQITNADIARNFDERSMNILYPRVSWGGSPDAYVGMEFPLLQWLAAALYKVFGQHDVICRGLSIFFSLATVVGLYGLGSLFWDRAVGRAAAFLYAISPSAIFFGRTFLSDVPMICFSVFAVWGFALYLREGSRGALVWGSAALALTCLVKVPAVLIFAPIAYLAWESKGWHALRDRALLAGLATAFLLTVAWYVHADVLFHRTGLGQAIWHPSGGYSPDIVAAAGPMMLVSHWATIHQLRDPEFYATLVQRLWNLHLTPAGLMVVLFGAAVLWSVAGRRFVDVWAATVVLFIFVSAEGNRYHEFHQLPILLPAALYFGLAARPAFDGAWLDGQARFGIGRVAAAAVLALAAWMGVHFSGIVPNLFRPDALDMRPIVVGDLLRRETSPDALIVTVEYQQYGANSPLVLYHGRRLGWSFDVASITPHLLRYLHTRYHAQYFVTLIWPELEKRHPDLATYLAAQERIGGSGDVALFRFR